MSGFPTTKIILDFSVNFPELRIKNVRKKLKCRET